MNMESLRNYCLSLKGSTEDFPFDQQILVFRVGGKIYALVDVEHFEYVNLKCDPERAIELREQYSAIQPGYHMSKAHWNSVYNDGSLSDSFIKELIKHSYDLIFKSLSVKIRKEVSGSI